MQVRFPHSAGLDVHKDPITITVAEPHAKGSELLNGKLSRSSRFEDD